MEKICIKCQVLFSGKNIINLSSAESAQRVVKVKMYSSVAFLFVVHYVLCLGGIRIFFLLSLFVSKQN